VDTTMLTEIQLNTLRMDLSKLSKDDLIEFSIKNTKTIDGMKELMNGARGLITCFQEARLFAEFHPDRQLHDFTFSLTDELVKADPDVTEIATVIATQASHYIKDKIRFGEVVG
jgi:hypothetical protein